MRAAAVVFLLVMMAAAAASAPSKHQAADDFKAIAGLRQDRRPGGQADGGGGKLHRHAFGAVP